MSVRMLQSLSGWSPSCVENSGIIINNREQFSKNRSNFLSNSCRKPGLYWICRVWSFDLFLVYGSFYPFPWIFLSLPFLVPTCCPISLPESPPFSAAGFILYNLSSGYSLPMGRLWVWKVGMKHPATLHSKWGWSEVLLPGHAAGS